MPPASLPGTLTHAPTPKPILLVTHMPTCDYTQQGAAIAPFIELDMRNMKNKDVLRWVSVVCWLVLLRLLALCRAQATLLGSAGVCGAPAARPVPELVVCAPPKQHPNPRHHTHTQVPRRPAAAGV